MKHLSLQTKLIGCILIISTALIVLSSYFLNRAWQENRRADEFYHLSRGTNYFIVTLKNLTFERGRTNVVLSSVLLKDKKVKPSKAGITGQMKLYIMPKSRDATG